MVKRRFHNPTQPSTQWCSLQASVRSRRWPFLSILSLLVLVGTGSAFVTNSAGICTHRTFAGCLQKSPSSAVGMSPDENAHASSSSIGVSVSDNVFSQEACLLLRELALEHEERAVASDGSSVFFRSDENEALTPLEAAIDSFLRAIGDETSEVVEYWSRDEHLNIDAHADIDEGELLDESTLRCPIHGHILYLDVEEGLKGPTFILPNKLVAWGKSDDEDDKEPSSTDVELVTVPAVQGRVVRFDGRALHAVPKPADRWLLSDQEKQALKQEEDDCEEEDDDWEDDGDNDDNETSDLRSVLLFNTWDYGPAFVDEDPALHMPVGIEIDYDYDDDDIGTEDSISNQWEAKYGPRSHRVHCNDKVHWSVASIRNTSATWDLSGDGQEEKDQVRVNLMGNRKRRRFAKKYARLRSSAELQGQLREAALQAMVPSRFVFREET